MSSSSLRMRGQVPPNEIKDEIGLDKFDQNKNKSKSNSKIDLDDYN